MPRSEPSALASVSRPHREALAIGRGTGSERAAEIQAQRGRRLQPDRFGDAIHALAGLLEVVLEAAGSSLDRVVKVTIYMVDLGELPEMNAIFSRYFPVDPPARTTLQCARLVADARVEIEAVAMA